MVAEAPGRLREELLKLARGPEYRGGPEWATGTCLQILNFLTALWGWRWKVVLLGQGPSKFSAFTFLLLFP